MEEGFKNEPLSDDALGLTREPHTSQCQSEVERRQASELI